MSVLSFAQALRSYFLFATVGFTLICDKALAASFCQVYPSEYAYEKDSVNRIERITANCRMYPFGSLPAGLHGDNYIHCDGTQLKLTDSNFGQEQYQTSDYYVWSSWSGDQLLFIFPTRVSLTTITLHYYSDNFRGLPRLSFYAVPDGFDVWDVPTTSYPSVDVASVTPGGEPAGRRNVSINVNFNTQKVLMYKSSSIFALAVSEVEFFSTYAPTPTTSDITQTMLPTTTTSANDFKTPTTATTEVSLILESTEDSTLALPNNKRMQCSHVITPREIVAWVLVVILVVLLIVSLLINGTQAVRAYRKGNKPSNDGASPERTVAMDSNPCYEASIVKQTEADQEAVHVYEMVKQHN